jgi:regulator of protease activity HflC (stomatin/prohibitin superfamily)
MHICSKVIAAWCKGKSGMAASTETVKTVSIRLPTDLKDWLDAQVSKYRSSQSSEVVRILRSEAERQAQKALG